MLENLILLRDHETESHLNADKHIWLLSKYYLNNFLPSIRHMLLELSIRIQVSTITSCHNYLVTGMSFSDIPNRMDF